MEVSGNVHVDGTGLGSSGHLLVWMELGWRLDGFGDDDVKISYQNALRAEVHRFSDNNLLGVK